MLDPILNQFAAELFGILDRDGSEQHGSTCGMNFFDLFNDRVPLFTFRPVNGVRIGNSSQRSIGRDGDHVKVVYLHEFGRFGHRSTGHPGQLLIELEEVLQRDRRQSLSLFLDPHTFFGLNRLMKTVTPLTTFHHSSRVFIDNDDLVAANDVVYIPFIEMVCA